MCISAEVSMIAFLTCSVSSVYLYKRNRPNDRWIAMMFGYLGIMQLLEYLMWMDQECSGLNQTATYLGFLHVVLQPIMSISLAYYMTKGNIPLFIYGLLFVYLIYSVPLLYSSLKEGQCSKPCNGSKIGLSWDFVNPESGTYLWIVFFLALVTPLLLMKKNGKLYFTANLIVWILSGIIGSYRCNGPVPIPSGSLWCLMAFMGPLCAIFIN